VKRGVFAFALVAMLAASGCSVTAGDGELADDWEAMAAAAPLVPAAEACYDASGRARDSSAPKWRQSIPCTGNHGAETFHVGQFPASVTAPPTDGDKDYRTAFEDCERVSKTYLGGDWFSSRIYLTLFVPGKPQWDAGARWYACQAMETQGVTTSLVVQRSGSLKGALATPGALAHGCTNVVGLKDSDWEDMTPIECTKAHDAEYAGAFVVPGNDFPKGDAAVESVLDRCWSIVAIFMSGTVEGIQVGYIPFGLVEKDWTRGHRYVRCWAWSDEYKTIGSAKGKGNVALPRA
jgi:hypothetical protein